MNVKQLQTIDGQKLNVWLCSACNLIYSDLGVAERCCICSYCSGVIDKEKEGNRCSHFHCEQDHCDKAEQKRLADAELVNDWTGPVYHPYIEGYNDGYFSDISDFLDAIQDKLDDGELTVEQIPKRVFICKVKPFVLDIDSAIENELERMYEGAEDRLEGIKELTEAVEKFNELNKDLESWYPEWKKAMEVPKIEWTING